MTSEREFEVLLDERLRALRAASRRRVRRQDAAMLFAAAVSTWCVVALALWTVL